MVVLKNEAFLFKTKRFPLSVWWVTANILGQVCFIVQQLVHCLWHHLKLAVSLLVWWLCWLVPFISISIEDFRVMRDGRSIPLHRAWSSLIMTKLINVCKIHLMLMLKTQALLPCSLIKVPVLHFRFLWEWIYTFLSDKSSITCVASAIFLFWALCFCSTQTWVLGCITARGVRIRLDKNNFSGECPVVEWGVEQ